MLDTAERRIDQGRYQAAAETLSRFNADAPAYPAARRLLIRCRIEQGRFAAAAQAARRTRPQAMEADCRLRLWAAFSAAHADDEGFAGLDALASACDRVLSDPASSPGERAVARELRARGEVLRFASAGRPPSLRITATEALRSAVEGHRHAGDVPAAVRSMLRLAGFCRNEPGADSAQARELLIEADGEARDSQLQLLHAMARLRLAELSAEDGLDGHGPPSGQLGDAAGELRAAGALLTRAGHLFGEALAGWSAAQLRMRYGAPDAVGGLAPIIAAFASSRATALEHEVWGSLFTWHAEHGDLTAARRAGREIVGARLPRLPALGLSANYRGAHDSSTR